MHGPLLFCLSRERNKLSEEMDLNSITIDMESLSGPFSDQSNRPDGRVFKVRAWSTEQNGTEETDLELLLTEFIDPTGEITFFVPSNPTASVSDDLIYDRPNREADNR